MERFLTFTVKHNSPSLTVGQLLHREGSLTKNQISQAKFRPRGILKNGVRCRVTEFVRPGDTVTVCLEEPSLSSSHLQAPSDAALPPLEILYEDQDLFIVNKPAGIVTHPCGQHYSDSLANQAAWYFRSRGENLIIRPIGRLDKETSGIVVFAKNQTAAARLQAQRSRGEFKKVYLAVVCGYLPADTKTREFPVLSASEIPAGSHAIRYPIGPDPKDSRKMTALPVSDISSCCQTVHTEKNSERQPFASGPSGVFKTAVTHYQVLYSTARWSLVSLSLDTGRTHQIRVHMNSIGHPLLGDTLYGDSDPEKAPFSFTRAALHAWRLSLRHPFESRYITLEAPLPEDFQAITLQK